MKKILNAIWKHARQTSKNVGIALVLTALPVRLGIVPPTVFPEFDDQILKYVIGHHHVIPHEALPNLSMLVRGTLEQFAIADPGIGTSSIVFLDSSEANAYSIPDGHIIVNLGLLVRVENQSQLAGILGHEIGHRELQAYRDLSAARFVLFGGTLFALGTWGLVALAVSLPAGLLIERFLQRQQEYAADLYAAQLMKKSGFISSEFGTFLGTKFHSEKYVPPLDDCKELLSTHPIIYKRALRILTQ